MVDSAWASHGLHAVQKEKGWTVAALQAAAQHLGLSPSASGMVSNGAAGLVEVWEAPTTATHVTAARLLYHACIVH